MEVRCNYKRNLQDAKQFLELYTVYKVQDFIVPPLGFGMSSIEGLYYCVDFIM